jgi:hypothetical protein
MKLYARSSGVAYSSIFGGLGLGVGLKRLMGSPNAGKFLSVLSTKTTKL